jgi:hypothetical protein
VLPDIREPHEMKKLVLPVEIHIWSLKGRAEPPTIGVAFAGSLVDENGVGVLIRDGKVAEVVQGGAVFGLGARTRKFLDHPVLGQLRFIGADQPWMGMTPCEPFADYAAIADVRAEHSRRRSTKLKDTPYLALDWDFARREFTLEVYTTGGTPPTQQHARALETMRTDQPRGPAVVLDALFDHYRANLERRRRDYRGKHRDEVLPDLESAEGLRELIELKTVTILPSRGKGGAAVGLVFTTAWVSDVFGLDFEEEIGVRWRDGKVEEIGGREVAEPQRRAKGKV